MAGIYDTEQQRIFIDRIKCITFREARDAGAKFIDRHWAAKNYIVRFNASRKLKLLQASQDIILQASGQQRKGFLLWRRRLQNNKRNMSFGEQLIIIVIEKD